MFRLFFVISVVLLSIKSFSQEIDLEKVEKVSSILCDCLNYNKEKDDATRISECTNVLTDGLSVIKDELTKEIYAQKADTYLQRNCLEYNKLIYKNVPQSDISLVDESTFESYPMFLKNNIVGEYTYSDFLGETFKVEINQSTYKEEILQTDFYIKFTLGKMGGVLIFNDTNHPFYSVFYADKEEIEVRCQNTNNGDLNIIFNLGHDIYLKKVLTKL